MALNKRQERIIAMMNDANEWITGKELSKLLNVSDRTIRSDMDAINRYYDENLIESNLRYGYHLNTEVFRTLDIEFLKHRMNAVYISYRSCCLKRMN